jgi:hypothetical protein
MMPVHWPSTTREAVPGDYTARCTPSISCSFLRSKLTVLAPPAGWLVWLHARATHWRRRGRWIVAKARQPQNQEFSASTAKRISVGMFRATFEFRSIRDSGFLYASLALVIQRTTIISVPIFAERTTSVEVGRETMW